MALPPKALEADYSSADAFLLRVLGAMAGTAAGGLAARGLWWICDELAGECPHAAWIPALALTAAGTSTGVALMAERAGRSPAWSYTLAGAGLGSVPGAVIMMRWGEGSDINTGVALMIFVPSVLVGSLVGNYVGQ